MICTKCNHEIFEGAKFCPSCGTAVDFGKQVSASDSLVSAMNGAAATSNGVPVPSNNIPMPSNGIPMPVNSGSGVSETAPSGTYGEAMPVIPPYVASVSANAAQAPVMPMPTASGEAAATVKKKSNGGKIALFSILGVLVIAIAATLVMFFTNRAAFLSTLMGKEKYATMVEGNSIKSVTDKLDIPAISNGVKTASGTLQSLYAAYGPEMLTGMTNTGSSGKLAPMSYNSIDYSTVTYPDGSYTGGGLDLETFYSELAAMLADVYGVNSVDETLSVNIELEEALRAMIQDASFSEVKFDEMLEPINGTTFNYNLTAKDGKAVVTMGTQGKILVNAKILLDGQDAYIALPFASDKALKITVPKGEQIKLDNVKPLELDEKELERLITECVEIYLDYYKNSSIEMENGKLTAAGVSVEGKVITAEFNGEKLSNMVKDIAKHIVNDDYLMNALVDYVNSLGAEVTKKEVVDEALDEIEYISDASEDDRFIITTVIDRSGEVLGKSFKGMYKDEVLCEFLYAETADQIGFEVDDPDYDELSNTRINIEKKDEENGTCTIKLTCDGEEITIVINYSDCKTAKFCGKDIPTGKITVGAELPKSLAEDLDEEFLAAINGAKLSIEIAADSANTIAYTFGVNVPDYGSVTLKNVLTAMNDESEIKLPSNVIDITDSVTGNITPGDDTYEQLMSFANEVTEALKKALPEFIADELDYYLPSGGISGGYDFNKNDVDYLLDDIEEDMSDIKSALKGDLTADKRSQYEKLLSEYTKLYSEVYAKGSAMTEAEFEEFDDRYYDLYFDLFDLIYSDDEPAASNDLAAQVEAKMDKTSEKLTEVYFKYYSGSGNSKAEDAFNKILKASEELGNYCMETGADEISDCTEAQLNKISAMLDELDNLLAAYETEF